MLLLSILCVHQRADAVADKDRVSSLTHQDMGTDRRLIIHQL